MKLIQNEFYDYWNAWSLNLRWLRIVLILQPLRYWEWKPRKCHIWRHDHPEGEWSGYHAGPFEISWQNDQGHRPDDETT